MEFEKNYDMIILTARLCNIGLHYFDWVFPPKCQNDEKLTKKNKKVFPLQHNMNFEIKEFKKSHFLFFLNLASLYHTLSELLSVPPQYDMNFEIKWIKKNYIF